ncbi:MAG TPA: chaperonin GroEL [Vicinamibacterales bacterium]|nr:chaperonin GroEL [Vicinamibacterales bacterium]
MAHTELHFRSDARERILHGAGALHDAVRITLGPKARCVLIGQKWGAPVVCNDGVTIAKAIDLEDPQEALGARMLREAAERTGSAVGDGTTTSTVLAYAIFADGTRNVAAGASAIDLKRGFDRGLRAAVAALQGQSRPVTTRLEKAQVATISAHNDVAIGEMVADAIERVGREGAITVEEARGTETTLEVVEGMQFDRGYLSPYFVTDTARMEAVLDEPLILLSDQKISTVKDLLPTLEQVAKSGRALLIVAEDVDAEALATLVVNRLRGVLSSVAVKTPGYGDRRRALLEDIATMSGGKVLSAELGVRLENARLEDFGRARRVIVGKDTTTIVGGGGAADAVKARCEDLRRQVRETKSDYDREKLEERLAKLSGGVAVIRAGAPSEAEMKSRKEAFEDAISATKAAVAEGIVPGAGLALLRCIEAVEAEAASVNGDVRTGVLIVRRALEAPARQIADNSALDDGVVVARMRAGSGFEGLDASTGNYVDLLEAGIVDPTKVVRVALENAVSIAGMLLLAEATLTEIPEPERERPALEPA